MIFIFTIYNFAAGGSPSLKMTEKDGQRAGGKIDQTDRAVAGLLHADVTKLKTAQIDL